MGICGRQGLGKLRHLDTQCLWVQQRVRDRSFELRKVRGDDNPADLFTKHLTSAPRVQDLLQKFGCEYAEGRAESAPELRVATGTTKGELLASVSERGAEDDTEELILQVEMEATTVWDGYRFPTTADEEHAGMPDAFPCRPGTLPHHHHDLQQRFPQLRSCDPLNDDDPPYDHRLEDRGRSLGAAKPRRAPTKATAPTHSSSLHSSATSSNSSPSSSGSATAARDGSDRGRGDERRQRRAAEGPAMPTRRS